MKKFLIIFSLMGIIGVGIVPGLAQAKNCTCDHCLIACNTNLGSIQSSKAPAKYEGGKCVLDRKEGQSNDQICQGKRFKGAAAKDKNGGPAVWCQDPSCS